MFKRDIGKLRAAVALCVGSAGVGQIKSLATGQAGDGPCAVEPILLFHYTSVGPAQFGTQVRAGTYWTPSILAATDRQDFEDLGIWSWDGSRPVPNYVYSTIRTSEFQQRRGSLGYMFIQYQNTVPIPMSRVDVSEL